MENIVSFVKDWFQEYRPEVTLLNQGLWILWAVWILLLLLAVFRVIKFRLSLDKEKKLWGDGSGPQKNAVVIVPIKGVTPRHTSDFFQSLLEQNYAKYRIIVTVETSDDPAAEWLSDQFGIDLSNPVWAPEDPENGFQHLQLVVAGKCKGRGQKVHNQLAAFEELTAEDEIIVFVDADIVCPPDWLARLTAPINRGTHDPATTYRWLVPKKNRLASLFASVINASVTTQGGNVREDMPWGGSMAISRAAFDDVDVPRLFEGSVNDDLRLGKAAKKMGYKVGYIRNLVRPTTIDFTWRSFFEFARRQYLQVKVFAPILYTLGNLILGIYALGFISIVVSIVMGNLWAWVPLVVATILDQIRAMTRESIYRNLFGEDKETYKRISRTSGIEAFMTPVYMLIHGLIVFSTWFMTKMEWGGVKYQVEGVAKTRVLHRNPIENTVSNSAVGKLALPAGGVFSGISAIGSGGFSANRSMVDESTMDTGTVDHSSGTVTIDDTQPMEVATSEPELEPVAVTHEETYEEEADAAEDVSEQTEYVAEQEEEGSSLLDDAGTIAAGVAAAAGVGALLADDEEETEEAAESNEPPFTFQKLNPVDEDFAAEETEVDLVAEETEAEAEDELVAEETEAEIEEAVEEDLVAVETEEESEEIAAEESEVAEAETTASEFGEWVEEEPEESVREVALAAAATEASWVNEDEEVTADAVEEEIEVAEEEAVVEAEEEIAADEDNSSVESEEEIAAPVAVAYTPVMTEGALTPVSAVSHAASAVYQTGFGAQLPESSRFEKNRKTPLGRHKKAGKKRVYLAQWNGNSRSRAEKVRTKFL